MKVWDPEEDKEPETLANAERMTWLDWCMVGVGILLAFWLLGKVLPSKAEAHSWYDAKCCNTTDCRQVSGVDANGIPWSEVEDLGDRYRWTSSKSGRVHIFLKGRDNVLPSRDANYHACETEYMSEPLCIYPPLGF